MIDHWYELCLPQNQSIKNRLSEYQDELYNKQHLNNNFTLWNTSEIFVL